MYLSGKTILVTGAGGGIGSAICRLVVARGAQLIATDLGDNGAGVAAELKATYLPLDVTREADWQQVEAQVRADFGRLNGLVNNAGILLSKPLLETTLADYQRINRINNEGVFLGMRTFAPLLAEWAAAEQVPAHGGNPAGSSIVNFSSIYGLGGQPGFAAYCAAKGAVRLVTKAAALEFAQARMWVRVNSVHPGPIDTPLARGPLEALVARGAMASIDAGMAAVARSYPGGRIGLPEDVAAVVCFLLSDDSGFVNGAELPVDYGFSAKAQ